MSGWEPGALVAERARTADWPLPCRLCEWAILPGERCADLADSSGTAHTGCIGTAAHRTASTAGDQRRDHVVSR